jgi:Arc/MetJ-type ribon-helix-helix transcriptional regulator
MKKVQVPDDLEGQIEELVSQGMFHSFQTAVEELIRLGLGSMKGGRSRAMPPGSIPQPERPNIPDPTRDILKM